MRLRGLLVGAAMAGALLRADVAYDAQWLQLKTVKFHGHVVTIRTVDPKKEDLRLFWGAPTEAPLHDFTALEARVKASGGRLAFAANAGMFQPDSSPVGLLVIDGQQISPLNLHDGSGNFCLKPNGVFVLTEDRRAAVMESSLYTAYLPKVRYATQSGPLLVQEGVIHPDFIAGSSNLKLRSGVGVRADGTIVFALASSINFYDFAEFFRTRERCPNALFLDGDISAFYTPGQVEPPGTHSFGPMFGLVQRPMCQPNKDYTCPRSSMQH